MHPVSVQGEAAISAYVYHQFLWLQVVKNSTIYTANSKCCLGDEDTNRVSKEYGTRTNLIVDVIIPFVATQGQDR